MRIRRAIRMWQLLAERSHKRILQATIHYGSDSTSLMAPHSPLGGPLLGLSMMYATRVWKRGRGCKPTCRSGNRASQLPRSSFRSEEHTSELQSLTNLV